jgi:outer membrane immunogenic protein
MKGKLLVIAAIAALTGSQALAADMALKAPLLPPPPLWTGWYVGVNGGGGWEHNDWTFPTTQFFAVAGQGFSTNPTGGVAGGQIGYNYQVGRWVIGGEFDGDWSGLKQTVVGPIPPFAADSYTTKLYDLESLTLRFGYAPANWLLYGKVGIATGTVNLSALSGVPVAGVAFSNSQRQWGPTLGVGLEYMLTPHFVVGLEYDFTALGGESVSSTATCTAVALCAGVVTPVTINGGVVDISTVTGRVSYKF